MKNNSFTSVIRKPHRGRAGLKRDAGTGEHLIFTNASVRLAAVAHYKMLKQVDCHSSDAADDAEPQSPKGQQRSLKHAGQLAR